VVCADLSEESAKETAQELMEIYGVGIGVAGTGISGCGPAIGLEVDITKRGNIQAMFEKVILAYGGLDNIIITAGIFVPPDKEGHIPDEKWALTYAINVTGPYLVADEAKKIWQAQGLQTSLVITTSANAAVSKQGSFAYDTSKAAANHLVRELAIELSSIGPCRTGWRLLQSWRGAACSSRPRHRLLVKYKIDFDEVKALSSCARLADFTQRSPSPLLPWPIRRRWLTC
jgi:NAD(P)-dependent dehydrogenase (short-subunit alcohol dehydrogenase family)